MSVTVYLDRLAGASYTRNRQGKKAVRIAIVDGLSGAPDEILYLASVADGMPVYGSAHPSIPGLFLYEINPEAIGAGQARVRLVYEPWRGTPPEGSAPAIVVGATVEQHSTHADINGNEMFVQYTDAAEVTHEQTPTASVLRPKMSLELTRRETVSPASKAATYVGKVNNAGWDVDPAAAARTWLCTGIVGRSSDGGDTYDVTYSFLYCADPPENNWDSMQQYIDPQTGRAPKSLVADTGRKYYQVYQQATFDALNLA